MLARLSPWCVDSTGIGPLPVPTDPAFLCAITCSLRVGRWSIRGGNCPLPGKRALSVHSSIRDHHEKRRMRATIGSCQRSPPATALYTQCPMYILTP